MLPGTLDYPPFPRLTWEDYFWASEIVLPSWVGFRARGSEYGGARRSRPADGTVRLLIAPLEINARTAPVIEQVAAFQCLMDNEEAIADAVAHALVEYCRSGDAYCNDDDHLLDELLQMSKPDDLCSLVELSCVHVLNVFHDGEACIGFEFACTWDEEHGAGVMTYRGQVIAAGPADHSFLEWVAEQGLERL